MKLNAQLAVLTSFLFALAVGCSGVPSSGTDGGAQPEVDAGSAGPEADAGPDPAIDGGLDAGLDGGQDAGASEGGDAGAAADSGSDAGTPTDGGSDAGSTPDAGSCGAVPSCGGPSECPVSTTACVEPTCVSGCCGTTSRGAGTSCAEDGGSVCDGAGHCVACNVALDCPAQTSVCRTNTCAADHTCGVVNASLGTACAEDGGVVCDGNGQCVSSHCADSLQDADESDIDCGGASCPACAALNTCRVGTDCSSRVCTGLVCQVPSCSDSVQNGTETAVDCGGSGTCPRCALALTCSVNTDCLSSACDAVSLVCVSNPCADHRQDGAETSVDCGGGTCAGCALGKACAVDGDCASNACDAVSLLCVSNPCADHRQDGAETAVDCGGGTCAACASGLGCAVDGDCASGACDLVTRTCAASQCVDERQDGLESDVDCGGGICTGCAVGKKCTSNADCQAGHVCSMSFPFLCQ